MSAIRIRPGEHGRLRVELPYDPERVMKIQDHPGAAMACGGEGVECTSG